MIVPTRRMELLEAKNNAESMPIQRLKPPLSPSTCSSDNNHSINALLTSKCHRPNSFPVGHVANGHVHFVQPFLPQRKFGVRHAPNVLPITFPPKNHLENHPKSHYPLSSRKRGVRYGLSVQTAPLPPSPPSPTSTARHSIESSESIRTDSTDRTNQSNDKIPKRRARLTSSSSIFDKNDQRYRCCCGGLIHIKNGALLIGVVECILTVFNLINAACLDAEYGQTAQPIRGVQTEAYLIISTLSLFLYVSTVAWMVYASSRRKRMRRSYLHIVPHLVVQMLTILILCATLIILAVLAFHAQHIKVAVDVIVFILLAAGLGLEVFFFALVLRCYYYLKDEYELSARAVPTCVVCVVSPHSTTSTEPMPLEVTYQPIYTIYNVDPDEYCVY